MEGEQSGDGVCALSVHLVYRRQRVSDDDDVERCMKTSLIYILSISNTLRLVPRM